MAAKHAPSIGSNMVTLAVISTTSVMPVSGARTTPAKKAAIPTTANPCGAMSSSGNAPRQRGEAQPELRADDQQGREQAARRARGIGHRA